jgi:hypothetical protein
MLMYHYLVWPYYSLMTFFFLSDLLLGYRKCCGNLHIIGNVKPNKFVGRSYYAAAALCKARNVFTRLSTGIVSSNPTRGLDVCLLYFCVCGVCVGRGLATG